MPCREVHARSDPSNPLVNTPEIPQHPETPHLPGPKSVLPPRHRRARRPRQNPAGFSGSPPFSTIGTDLPATPRVRDALPTRPDLRKAMSRADPVTNPGPAHLGPEHLPALVPGHVATPSTHPGPTTYTPSAWVPFPAIGAPPQVTMCAHPGSPMTQESSPPQPGPRTGSAPRPASLSPASRTCPPRTVRRPIGGAFSAKFVLVLFCTFV